MGEATDYTPLWNVLIVFGGVALLALATWLVDGRPDDDEDGKP